jgi:hypothetical protein
MEVLGQSEEAEERDMQMKFVLACVLVQNIRDNNAHGLLCWTELEMKQDVHA